MAILPGLVRYDEAFGTEPIRHAFRVTVRSTNGYVFPASHRAGSTTGALPMGARLRLKASVNLVGLHAGRAARAAGDEDLRPDRRRQRLGHVHHRHLGSALGSAVRRRQLPDRLPEHPRRASSRSSSSAGRRRSWSTATATACRTTGRRPSASIRTSATGVNGAAGDPDGDGVSNAAERTAGTHPRGFERRLFAEGVSNAFFTTRLAALNLGSTPAHVQFRFLRPAGAPVTHEVTIPARDADQRRSRLDQRRLRQLVLDGRRIGRRHRRRPHGELGPDRLRQPRRDVDRRRPRRRGSSPRARRTAASTCST